MLRLEILSRTPEEAILKVEGWIAEEGVLLLEQQGRQMRQEAKHLVLDLQGVRSIDRAGVALLKCWTQDGVALRRPSPFVQALLETHGLAQDRLQSPSSIHSIQEVKVQVCFASDGIGISPCFPQLYKEPFLRRKIR